MGCVQDDGWDDDGCIVGGARQKAYGTSHQRDCRQRDTRAAFTPLRAEVCVRVFLCGAVWSCDTCAFAGPSVVCVPREMTPPPMARRYHRRSRPRRSTCCRRRSGRSSRRRATPPGNCSRAALKGVSLWQNDSGSPRKGSVPPTNTRQARGAHRCCPSYPAMCPRSLLRPFSSSYFCCPPPLSL